MQAYRILRSATVIAAIVICAPGNAGPATVELALSDILRCSPATQPDAGSFERVTALAPDRKRERIAAGVVPVDVYDPADCARREQDYAAEEFAASRTPA